MTYHLPSTGTKTTAEASPFDPVWGIGLRADDPEARDHRRLRGKKLLGKKAISSVHDAICTVVAGLETQASSQQFCTPTTTDGIHEILQRRLALELWRALAQVLLRSFRPVFLARRRTAVPRSWLSRLESSPPSFYQNMTPASSTVSLLSTTPILPLRLRFTVELTQSCPMVGWRSLTLVPHRLSSDATYWIACSRWGRHPLRASGIAPLVAGVALANLPLCKLRRASA